MLRWSRDTQVNERLESQRLAHTNKIPVTRAMASIHTFEHSEIIKTIPTTPRTIDVNVLMSSPLIKRGENQHKCGDLY